MKIVLNLKIKFGFKKSCQNFNYGFSYHWATLYNIAKLSLNFNSIFG